MRSMPSALLAPVEQPPCMRRRPFGIAGDRQGVSLPLVADGRSVRLSLPGLPVAGLAKPIPVNIDFETGVVDQIIERLTGSARPHEARPSTCEAAELEASRRSGGSAPVVEEI